QSVSFSLKEGVTWSDGEPLTSEDVRFTWEWALDDNNGAVLQNVYQTIEDVEVEDDLNFTVRFANPNPSWADAFTGMGSSIVIPKHILEGADQSVLDEFRINPIG